MLIDARHGLKPNDDKVLDLLDEAAVPYQIVLTKSDKIKPPALEALRIKTLDRIKKRPAAHPELIATSSEKKLGLDELRAEIAGLMTV